MCGIAGFFGGTPRAPGVAARVLDALRTRGPDARHARLWGAQFRPATGEVHHALLHARLSIIDPRPEADQPMANEAGDVWVCYNGEVYGWQDDARALEGRGVRFRTRSDTEFILRAYEAWGLDCLERLRGMFALAILDLRRQTLYVIRDRLGLKPLVYYHGAGGFAFASTVRALLPCLPAGERGLSPEALDAYLAHRYVPAPRTVLAAARRLENGHYLRVDLQGGGLTKIRYWHPEPLTGDWRAELDRAIELRTVADRPVGIFLSGGVDSSVLAARLAAGGHSRLHAFTAAFPGSPRDESGPARQLAERLGLPHETVPIPARIGTDFDAIVASLDEPFADPSSFPTWYLARAASREVKVVLAGDGGDELLAGYKRYAKHLRTAWRRHLRVPGLRPPASADSRGAAKLLAEAGMEWLDAYSLRFSGFTPGQRRWLQPDAVSLPPTRWRPAAADGGALDALLAVDMDNYLPEYILRKSDLCTMAHGLELRAPFLDHRWYQVLLGLGAGRRFTREPKALLREVCPVCDELAVFERKKSGFSPHVAPWLDDDLAERLPGLGSRLDALSDGQLAARPVDAVVALYRRRAPYLAEQVLQLLILDESLRQLATLAGVGEQSKTLPDALDPVPAGRLPNPA